MFLYIARRNYWIAIFPAWFMSVTAKTYIVNAPIGFNLPKQTSVIIGVSFTVMLTVLFFKAARKRWIGNLPIEEDISEWENKQSA